ncbi:MAG TPA: DUF1036 domain-containing protein [Oligoflexus sp.]|uniref:DUF1036 domain-containing protein n=1 Tax=Oligoflexus sp. TaxID=1971216 RepID=UPI002D56F2F0|nr:DUF1036 domain-containing protein [Oligoflexus sp.]HYX33289.1 DUF1036 domain-containing protein [Oligoflexus sp.]
MKKIIGALGLTMLLLGCDSAPETSETMVAQPKDEEHSRLVLLRDESGQTKDLIFVNRERGFRLKCGDAGKITTRVENMARQLGFAGLQVADTIFLGSSEADKLNIILELDCDRTDLKLWKILRKNPDTQLLTEYFYLDFNTGDNTFYQIGCQGLLEALGLRPEQAIIFPEGGLNLNKTNDATDISCNTGESVKVAREPFVEDCMNSQPATTGPLFAKLAKTQPPSFEKTDISCRQLWSKLELKTALDLSFQENEVKLQDIQPLRHLKSLLRVSFKDQAIRDFSPLADLTQLVRLDLSGNPITHINFLSKLGQLNSLTINQAAIDSLAVLHDKTFLQTLDIKGTQIQDLSPLEQLPHISGFTYDAAMIDPLTCPQEALSAPVKDLCRSIYKQPGITLDTTSDLRQRLSEMSQFKSLNFKLEPAAGTPVTGEFLEIDDTCDIFSLAQNGRLSMLSTPVPLPENLCTVTVQFRTSRGLYSNILIVRALSIPKLSFFPTDAEKKINLPNNYFPASAIVKLVVDEHSCSGVLLDPRHAAFPLSCLFNSKGELRGGDIEVPLSSSRIRTRWTQMVNNGANGVAVVRFANPLLVDSLRGLEPKVVADEDLLEMTNLFSFGTYNSSEFKFAENRPSIQRGCSIYKTPGIGLTHDCAASIPNANGGPVFAEWGGRTHFVGLDLGSDKTGDANYQRLASAEEIIQLYNDLKKQGSPAGSHYNICNKTPNAIWLSLGEKRENRWETRSYYLMQPDSCRREILSADSGEVAIHGWHYESNSYYGEGYALCTSLGSYPDAEGMICPDKKRRPYSSLKVQKDQYNTFVFSGAGRPAWTSPPLVYGRSYALQNAYSNWSGGYLARNVGMVWTSKDVGTRWKLVSLAGKQAGEEVKANDPVALVDPDLDSMVIGRSGEFIGWDEVNYMGKFDQRLYEWKIVPTDATDSTLRDGRSLHFKNMLNAAAPHYLDTRAHCSTHLCVFTSTSPDRDSGSGTWRLVE